MQPYIIWPYIWPYSMAIYMVHHTYVRPLIHNKARDLKCAMDCTETAPQQLLIFNIHPISGLFERLNIVFHSPSRMQDAQHTTRWAQGYNLGLSA